MRAWTSLLVAALLAGCPRTDSGNDGGGRPTCLTRADCEAGLVCTADGFCAGCTTSGQCSVKEACDAETRTCALLDGWGTDCATNDECQAGSWCKQGLCQPRSAVSLCPGGETSECPQFERCNRVNLVCEEDLGCSTVEDCSAGETCNTGSRQCVPRCTLETQADVCAASERCVEEKCVQCAADADCGPGLSCDAAGRCSAGTRCYTDRDCPVPLVCHAPTGACLAKPPPCSSDDACAANQRCDVPSGRCIARDCQPDRYEPNDGPGTAFGVSPQAWRGMTLCEGDVDWFSIPLARGDQLGINVEADPFAEDTFATVIKDAAGRTVASGHFLASYVAPVADTYFVVVSTTDDIQPYDMVVLKSRGTPCDDDPWEANDAPQDATPLNASTGVDGVVCPQDQDWFLADARAGQGLRVTARSLSQSGVLSLCVASPDGATSLGCASDVSPVVSVSSAALGSLAHVAVQVRGADERTTGAYSLTLEYP